MSGHIYIRISKPAILVLLALITLPPRTIGLKARQGIAKPHSKENHGPGHNRHGDDLPDKNKPNCTDLDTQLIEFYADVYMPRIEQGFLLMNLATYINVSKLEPADVSNYTCLRVKDASEDDFADLGLVTCNLTDQTQVVHIYEGDYGFFFATDPNLTKHLTVDSGSLEENALVIQYQLQNMITKSQQWSLIPYLDDEYVFLLESTLSTGKCLTAHDENMTLHTCGNMSDISNFPKNQLWVMLFSHARIGGQLKNKLLSKCLYGENDNAESDFAEVGFKDCNSADAAQTIEFEWSINSVNPQAIEFSTGKVLSVIGPSVSSNAPVKQMTRFYFGNQLWTPGAETDGWFRIQNVETEAYCLGVAVDYSHLEMQLCADATTAGGFDAVAQQNGWLQIRNIGNSEYCLSAAADGSYLEMTECTNVLQA